MKDTRLRFSGYLNKAWLRAGAQITEAIVHITAVTSSCAGLHPFWFQSFGAVIGMDWYSSGITTSVIGSLAG